MLTIAENFHFSWREHTLDASDRIFYYVDITNRFAVNLPTRKRWKSLLNKLPAFTGNHFDSGLWQQPWYYDWIRVRHLYLQRTDTMFWGSLLKICEQPRCMSLGHFFTHICIEAFDWMMQKMLTQHEWLWIWFGNEWKSLMQCLCNSFRMSMEKPTSMQSSLKRKSLVKNFVLKNFFSVVEFLRKCEFCHYSLPDGIWT